jgi:Tfp pilus assembly protein PilN
MLPTRINLLPPEKQVHLQRMIRSEFLRNSLAVLFIVSVIIGISLLGGKYILQNYFFDVARTLHAVNSQPSDMSTSISVANARISTAEKVLQTYYYWPTLITEISTAVPEEIVISKMNLDKKTGIATITGTSVTRDALLRLGESLRSLPSITSVDIPISQLTQQDNVSFTIRMTLSL